MLFIHLLDDIDELWIGRLHRFDLILKQSVLLGQIPSRCRFGLELPYFCFEWAYFDLVFVQVCVGRLCWLSEGRVKFGQLFEMLRHDHCSWHAAGFCHLQLFPSLLTLIHKLLPRLLHGTLKANLRLVVLEHTSLLFENGRIHPPRLLTRRRFLETPGRLRRVRFSLVVLGSTMWGTDTDDFVDWVLATQSLVRRRWWLAFLVAIGCQCWHGQLFQ